MQTIEKILDFFIRYSPTTLLAVGGYFLGHYLSCLRLAKEKKCNFILDELNNLQRIIEESLNDIVSANSNKDFVKIVLSRQRLMNRTVEFILKILNKYNIKNMHLKEYYDEIREFLTGDEFSITASKHIDKQKLNQLKIKTLCEIDDLKWKIICRF